MQYKRAFTILHVLSADIQIWQGFRATMNGERLQRSTLNPWIITCLASNRETIILRQDPGPRARRRSISTYLIAPENVTKDDAASGLPPSLHRRPQVYPPTPYSPTPHPCSCSPLTCLCVVELDPEHYSGSLPMVKFPTPESITQNCALGSDNDTGGYSTARLDHVVEDGIPCLRFSGNLSLHVPIEARKRGMTHSGWAGWRTRPMGANFFNRY